MSRVSPEIAAAQAAYAARPYSARVESSHFSGTFRFDSMGEAIDYIFHQAAYKMRDVRDPMGNGFGHSWVAMDLRRSYVEGPDGFRIPARYVLMLNHIDSHRGIA